MSEQNEQNEQGPAPLEGDALALAKLRIGVAAGLTIAQAERLLGTDEEALTADAAGLAAELNPTTPAPSVPLVGGPRGADVGHRSGTLDHGAHVYRVRHGLS
ncbi:MULTISPECIES: hypothetical protein [Streptomyces]|uniref:hypothetical protein n=1 Tax=Streptomyces TaxID=1883 RepID=UPI000D50FB73|nr:MULTISPECIES: hypothetical protein [Streptomyces]PVC62968.1 hypothetical protein DBP15_28525 [Streptomyces sp. CS065A]